MRRICMAAALIASALAVGVSADFVKSNTYTQGQYSDVPAAEWYDSAVGSAYELGFMNGTGEGIFSPTDTMTVAEAITVASRVNAIYYGANVAFAPTGDNWYDVYVSYAKEQKLITDDTFDNYERNITRREMAILFANAVDASYLNAVNDIKEIPDVPETDNGHEELMRLYKAGVVLGNDAYGTFLPNNDIIRAEAAAIICRVALPENRLQKTVIDANYDDAYYLVNEMSFRIGDGSSLVGSAWNYDNRNSYGVKNNQGNHIYDYYTDGKVEMWRDIEDVNAGLLGWEFYGEFSGAEDGIYFKITDDEEKPLIALTTAGGKLLLNGTDTGVKAADGKFYFKVAADLDNNAAEFYFNGVKCGDTYALTDVTASRVYIGSGEKTTGVVKLYRCDIYKDYLVNDNFLVPADVKPADWNVNGDVKTVRTGGQGYNDTNSALLPNGASAAKTFPILSGKVVAEAMMLMPEKTDVGKMTITANGAAVASVTFNADGVFDHAGNKLRFHNNNIWQTVRVELDTVGNTALFRINGKTVGTAPFAAYAETVDGIVFESVSGNVYFDDVKVYMTHDYDDYVPEPVKIEDDYDVIMNMCSLWRQGTHSGWNNIDAFDENIPALGFYDEGIPEVADWEIKMMVENGIDVQHLCWFSPQYEEGMPLKKPSLSSALHEGFFNAKYSDEMKFMLMWENSGGASLSGFDQFVNYIWPYWMDYYFLDERYYLIDNMPVITVWSGDNFLKTFGSKKDCLEAIDFMKSDCRDHGFDGFLILFLTQSGDNNDYATLKSIGADGGFAYHWIQYGSSAAGNISRLTNTKQNGSIYMIPSVSVGFNGIAWSGVRYPMISVDEHKQVLEFVRDEYLPDVTGTFANKLVISTWNEFGEGTYVAPCEKFHGFGYLENVAEVISGVTDHSNNIYPTAQQKARLGHLYPASKSNIRFLDTGDEAVKDQKAIIHTWAGTDLKQGFGLDTCEYINDGSVHCITNVNDSCLESKPDTRMLATNAEDIEEMHFIIQTDTDAQSEIFFMTTESPNPSQANSFRFQIKASGDYKEYVIDMTKVSGWKGKITGFRFDITACPADYYVKEISLVGVTEDLKPYTITIDKTEYDPIFAPVIENDELYVCANPANGFFSLLHFYHEWSKNDGKLLIRTQNGHEIVFTVGRDVALVDGKEQPLAKAVELRDGLPVLPMNFIDDIAGFTYTVKNKAISLSTLGTRFDEILANRKPFEYEFNVPGDLEGFTPLFTSAVITNGALVGDATIRTDMKPAYDPMLTNSAVNFDTLLGNKVVIGMKHQTLEPVNEAIVELFFVTDTETGYSQDKSAQAKFGSSSNGKTVEYTLDFSENEHWKGIITGVRLDPLNMGGHYEIDYVRFLIDPEMEAKNREIIAAKEAAEAARLQAIAEGHIVVNGDAEDPDEPKAFWNDSLEVKISVDGDRKVWELVPIAGKQTWSYMYQYVNYEPGAMYEVSCDLKLTAKGNGETSGSTEIYFNPQYTGADGKFDHQKNLGWFSIGEDYKNVKFRFEIPADAVMGKKDTFSFYSNPIEGEGVGYCVDNIEIRRVTPEELENE